MMRIAAIALALLLAGAPVAAQQPSLAQLQQAAAGGQAEAQFQLAERLRIGTGVVQNYARAAEFYLAAANQGEARAQNALAALLIRGLGVAQDPEAGFALLSLAAESGAAKHIHDLGSAYQQGIGTTPDPAQAVALYQRASDLGWQESTVSLAVMYQNGEGVARDLTKAIALYTGPAESGHPRAQNNLGLILVRGEGVEQDYALAAEWFRKAAAQGLPVALTNLGVMYENGFGVARDEEEAKRLYRLAGQGDAQGGEAEIALVLDPRLNAPRAEEAKAHLMAANAGDPVAQYLLGYLMASGALGKPDNRMAIQLFQAAADKGLPAAMANLGILTFHGRGTLQDFVEGHRWLTLAAAAGHSQATEVRDRLAEKMTPAQINAANAAAEQSWAELRAN